jgi:hypothetical protein
MEPPTNFRTIPRTTSIWLFVGDRDTSVGNSGAIEMDQRLLSFGVPPTQIHGAVIRSHGFSANHMSVYDLSPAAKKAIWDRADTLIRLSLNPA